MSFVDLHVHSTASDGTLSPSQVVRLAASLGLQSIALTDHDTVSGINEALDESKKTGIEVIPGVELSCVYRDKEIHILGLFVRHEDPSFLSALENLLAVRQQRNEEMIRRFQADGFPVTRQALTAGNPHTVITRAHFARLLTEKGITDSMGEAFQKYLQYGGKYCPRKDLITPEQALKVLTDNKAFPVLAHPCQYKLGWSQTETLISHLALLGMRGLEVYHSSHSQEESQRLRILASQYGLLPTGGSDFHGTNKPDISLGTGRGSLNLPASLLEDIRKAIAPKPQTSL